MRNDDKKERKRKELEQRGTLNPRAEQVRDPAFLESDFLDPDDLVQVKYEMLRRVSTEGCTVTETVGRFGVSRPTFYRAQADFEQEGLVGLVPERRGPRGPYKLTDEVAEFLEAELAREGKLMPAELAARAEKRFGRRIHPRTVERGLARRKKKSRTRT